MSLQPQEFDKVPEYTVKVARAAFPKGNGYLKLRDELITIYQDELFADLFPSKGQPAESPGRLALVTVLQFAEGLSDRQAADAVRSRIDWKYLLGLELSDPGFDYSVLSEFRSRLVNGKAEERLLDRLVELLKARNLIKERGKQRTDSTHVQAAVRQLNRLEKVGETLRAALNSLANVAPEWLKTRAPAEWYERYGARIESYRLPKAGAKRDALGVQIGEDGYQLMGWVYREDSPEVVKKDPMIEILRRVWIQEYYRENDHTQWRKIENTPQSELSIHSPYDPEARYSKKRETGWVGYKVHFTETCEEDLPHLIVEVETTPATKPDYDLMPVIHQALAKKQLLPEVHLVDTGYVDAGHVLSGEQKYGIHTLGHPMPDTSWQSQAKNGFDLSHFIIDWEKQVVTCPSQRQTRWWNQVNDDHGNPVIVTRFSPKDCQPCLHRENCTHSQKGGRIIRLRIQTEYDILQKLRQNVHTEEFKKTYCKRAGIEGTFSQAMRRCDLRRARYIGQVKTHFQHLVTAAAINLARLFAWFSEIPMAQTRTSSFLTLVPQAL